MRKIEIYSEMLYKTLTYIRCQQTGSFFSKGIDKTCYMEAEFLHDVIRYINDERINSGDVKFLNYHARYYLEHATQKRYPNYESHKKNIMRLFDMVPNELKSELEWNPHNFEKMSTKVDSHNAKCRCPHAED